MRILYVMYGFPYPLASGYLRSYFMIKGLAERHQVTLVSVVGADFQEAYRDGLAPFTEQIITATSTSRAPLLQKIVGRVRTLVGGFGADPAIQQLNAAIRQLRAAQGFDLAITGGGRATPLTESFADLPIIVDLCDADTMRLRESLRYSKVTRLPLILLELLQIRGLERQMLADGSHILFAAARDRDALLDERARTRTSIVPNGVDCTFWQRTSAERGTDTIVFTGVMDYPPNNDAAHFLIEEIFPLVRQKRPHARLLIVGRNPKEPLQRAGQAEGVTVTGGVEDMRPYSGGRDSLRRAAPLRLGHSEQGARSDGDGGARGDDPARGGGAAAGKWRGRPADCRDRCALARGAARRAVGGGRPLAGPRRARAALRDGAVHLGGRDAQSGTDHRAGKRQHAARFARPMSRAGVRYAW